MADGHLMHAGEQPSPLALSLDEAITRLEAGITEAIVVDLGNGRSASADGARGADGLLQRLRGHRMMLALADGKADLPRFSGSDKVVVAPQVQEILDAVAAKR